MSKEQEQFGRLLGETARLWRTKLDQRLRPLGLSQAKWMVLLQVNLSKTPMTQKELSERLSVEGPSLVRLLDRMEEEGWVVRQACAQDRRAKKIHQTEKAEQMSLEIKRIAKAMRREIMRDIDADELALASRVLQAIKQRAELL